MKKLILFDIDRTLIINKSEKSYSTPIKNLHGIEVRQDNDYSGLTDSLILSMLLKSEGWDNHQIEASLPKLKSELERTYLDSFRKDSISLIPGARELLDALNGQDVALGLVTGNLKAIAKAKLEAVGIYHYFEVGGFGDDPHETRAELVEIAVGRAGFHSRKDDVVVIGDTELDIQAALDAGVRNAVAVSNGFGSVTKLAASGASVVLDDFLDTNEVFAKIGLKNFEGNES